MKRHFGIPATGDQNHRGVDSSRPHTASADAGSNVIQLADHPGFSPGRLNSERLTAAPLFILRPNTVQAPIDIGVALFWLFYLAAALTGFGIVGWSVCLVIIRSLGL